MEDILEYKSLFVSEKGIPQIKNNLLSSILITWSSLYSKTPQTFKLLLAEQGVSSKKQQHQCVMNFTHSPTCMVSELFSNTYLLQVF